MPHTRRLLAAVVLGAVFCVPLLGRAGAWPVQSASTATWMRGWPMAGHDPGRTGLSPVQGPLHPRLAEKRAGFSAEFIAPDGSIVGTRAAHPVLAVLSPNGSVRTLSSSVTAASAIRPDGTILAFSNAGQKAGTLGHADAVSPTGRLVWRADRIRLAKGAAPLATAAGQFYIPVESHPESRASGLWLLSTGGKVVGQLVRGNPIFGVARGSDGTIYILLYDLRAGASFVEAYSPSLREKWGYRLDASAAEPGACDCLMVDSAGRAYVGELKTLLALDSAGHVRWRVTKRDGILTIAEQPNGSVLVAGNRTLTAISSAGRSLWNADIHLRHRISPTDMVSGVSLAVDRAGTSYVGTADGRVVVVTAGGAVVARVRAGGYHHGGVPGVMLGPSGSLVVAGTDSAVYIYR